MQNKMHTWLTRAISALSLLTLMGANVAQAAILFQDDDFHDIASDAILIDYDGAGANDTSIQFGNDGTASENGNINWDITLNEFQFDHTVDITGDLDVSGNADFTDATEFHMREVADEAAATCTTLDELVLDTTENRIYTCTGVGSPGTWVAVDSGSADDFESVYSTDADDTLTTSNGNFTIAPGTGEFDVTSTGLIDFNSGSFELDTTGAISLDAGAASNITTSAGDLTMEATAGSTNVTGGEAAADAIRLNTTNAAGGIDIDAGTGGIALDTTGVFSLDGVGASNVTTDSGNLALATSTSGDVDITGADNVDLASTAGDVTLTSGDDILFDDAQLTAPVQLTDTATGIAATYGTTGIIDALNTLSATTAGDGASNVGTEAGSFTNISPATDDVQAALEAIDSVVGSGAPNNEVLIFYPEYPDAVIFQDGTSNKGKLEGLYDDTNDEHYYEWTTKQNTAQDIDIRFRFAIPADFADLNDFTYRYRTGNTTEAQNDVEIGVYNATDETAGAPTLCGQDTTNGSAAAWTTGTIAEATLEAGCTGGTALDAGDIVEVLVKLIDATSAASTYADIGVLTLGYDN